MRWFKQTWKWLAAAGAILIGLRWWQSRKTPVILGDDELDARGKQQRDHIKAEAERRRKVAGVLHPSDGVKHDARQELLDRIRRKGH